MPRPLLAALALAAALSAGLACSSAEPQAERAKAPPAKPHTVLLILDEFPGDSLLDERGRVDPVRYPNFAALAADSVWFRNAYSSYDSTTKAVPLILDGMRPRPGTTSDRRGHPRSLFDMFGREGYRMYSSEEASALCPPSMCRGGRARRPAILPNLMAGRPARFKRWVGSIEASRRPGFWVKHLLLPHGPYLYLPSGARSRPRPRDLLPGMNTVPGFHDEFLTRHNEQRYLLQLGYTDRLLGTLVRKLKREGIYDDTLLVVVADHGYAWQAGVETRRSVNPANVEELAPVPLFVKRPGQRRGRVSATYARTLDVPSTIAGVLGFPLGYRDDGDSAFSAAAERRRRVSLTVRDFSARVSISGRRWRALRGQVVRRRLADFGSGDLAGLFARHRPQPRADRARGRRASPAPRAARRRRRRSPRPGCSHACGAPRAWCPRRWPATCPAAPRRPAASSRWRVNGRIAAVGRSFHLNDGAEHFALNVPEESLREGRNRVELFEVVAAERLRLLARS